MKQITLRYLHRAFGLTIGILCSSSAFAQTSVYWVGNNDDGVWSSPGNWSGGYLPQSGDVPMFAHHHGATTRNITVDGGDRVVSSLIFESTAANDFTFWGAAFVVAPYTPIGSYYGINVRSTPDAVVTFNNDIRFNGGHHVASSGGSLTFNGNISISSPGTATEYLANYSDASSGSSFTQNASSVLSGSNISSLDLRGRNDGDDSITFTLNGANTFNFREGSFLSFYGSGTLNLGHSQALGGASNALVIGLPSYNAVEKRSVIITGNHDIANEIYLRNMNGSTTIGGSNTGGTAKFSGDIYTYYSSEGPGSNNPTKFLSAAGGTVEFSGRLISFPEGGSGVTDLFEIVGDGTVAFTRAGGNSYTGGTLVSSGTLRLSNSTGSGTGSGAVEVANGAILTGSGLISPQAANDVTIRGILRPGDSKGLDLRFSLAGMSKLRFEEDSSLEITLGDNATYISFSTAGDWLAGTGNVTLSLTLGEGFDYGSSYLIFSNVSTDGISFQDIVGYDPSTYTSLFTRVGDDYYLSFAPIPEPSTWALLSLSVAGLGLRFLHRRRSA